MVSDPWQPSVARKAKIQLWGYRCERCEHEWILRNNSQECATPIIP